MTVRPATLADWPAIEPLICALNAEQVALGVPDFTQLHLDTLRLALEQGIGGVFVAADDDHGGEIVGVTGMVRFPNMPPGFVAGVGTYVFPELRRTKVAHDLGTAAKGYHRERGGEFFEGTTYLVNRPSIARCLAEGAEIVGFVLRYPLKEASEA